MLVNKDSVRYNLFIHRRHLQNEQEICMQEFSYGQNLQGRVKFPTGGIVRDPCKFAAWLTR